MRGRRRQTPLPEHLHLHPDLWREVLLRLPAKTLLQFRSVCKTWCSFIDSPDFISMHLKLYQNNNSANTHLLSVEYLHLPNSPDYPNYNIRRSDTMRRSGELVKLMDQMLVGTDDMIDGLLLVHSSENHMLWNPSIRKSVVLPRCPYNFTSQIRRFYHLGFDSSSSNYKVACFELRNYLCSKLSIAITIYSLRDHCWRGKHIWENVPRFWFDLFRYEFGVECCQGALYWRPFRYFVKEYNYLLSLNLDTEEISYVEMPDLKENMLRFCFVMNGSLAVLGVSWATTCVWVMEKIIDLEVFWKLFSEGDSDYNAYKFFSASEDHRVHIMYIENSGTLLVHYDRNLMFYNIMTYQVHQRKLKFFECEHLMTYVESLVLHKGYERATLNSLT